ncbi:MAG: SMP-30/gluconolactonase/LRE family protein [Steroidobacteraceae bacterium]
MRVLAGVLLPAAVVAAALQTLASVPTNGLEGLDVAVDGTLYVTDATARAIHRIDARGAASEFARLDAVPQAIRLAGDGALVTAQRREPDFAAWQRERRAPTAADFAHLGAVLLELDRDGRVRRTLAGPDGAFFNGTDRLGDAVLIADSTAATIWRAEPRSGRLQPWLRDARLAGPGGRFPGANGLKVAAGFVYVANTAGNALYRIAVDAAGTPRGELQQIATVAAPDDFDVAADGTIYLPSEGRVLRVAPAGAITELAAGCDGCDTARLAEGGRALLLATHGFGADAGPGRVHRLELEH